MRRVFLLLILALMSKESFAFESGQLSLDTPNVLLQGEGAFGIRHRFYGEIDDVDRFFGADDGGNMYLTLKYALFDNLVLGVDHTRDESAYGVGLEYSYDFTWFKAGIRANGFRLNKGVEKYHSSYHTIASLQTPNYFEHLNFTVNYGYDAYYKHQIMGGGIDLNVNNFMPFLTFTEKLSILGEYYPQVDKVDGVSGKYDSYAFGIKFQTYAHHFEILATNSTNMDPRTMSMGTNSDKLHLGFNINRKF
ncbi:MAG: hypothetical protein JXQ67_02665 [Campylobacterales bacterium]|nr:hypothetical protein [Campylobacterales bacterium]